MTNLTFSTKGHDDFIDFIKAYAILCVVVGHALPAQIITSSLFYVWGSMQVPLFVLIQSFHSLKKDERPKISFRRLWQRIIYPFLLVEAIIIIGMMVRNWGGHFDVLDFIKSGGKGPGSYYPCIYLQIAVVLPLAWSLFKRFTMRELLIPSILLCIGFDLMCSVFTLPDWIYRLLALRYIFLIYLGAIWVKSGIKLNVLTIALSIASIAATVFFRNTDFDLEPWFYNTAWKTHRWLCYFYVSSLMCMVLHWLYCRLNSIEWLVSFIKEIAKSSYEIFLIQMVVFVFVPPLVHHFFRATNLSGFVLFPCVLLMSVFGGVLFRRYAIERFCKREVKD